MPFFILVTAIVISWGAFRTKHLTEERIKQNLKNECLEYQHTENDEVVCTKRLSEEQINQILDR